MEFVADDVDGSTDCYQPEGVKPLGRLGYPSRGSPRLSGYDLSDDLRPKAKPNENRYQDERYRPYRLRRSWGSDCLYVRDSVYAQSVRVGSSLRDEAVHPLLSVLRQRQHRLLVHARQQDRNRTYERNVRLFEHGGCGYGKYRPCYRNDEKRLLGGRNGQNLSRYRGRYYKHVKHRRHGK